MNDDIAGKLLGHVIKMKEDVSEIKKSVESTDRSVQRLATSNDEGHAEIKSDIKPLVTWWNRRQTLRYYRKWAVGGIVAIAGGTTTIWIAIQAVVIFGAMI